MATNTLWVPFRPKASSSHSADGRPAQVVDVTLRRRFDSGIRARVLLKPRRNAGGLRPRAQAATRPHPQSANARSV